MQHGRSNLGFRSRLHSTIWNEFQECIPAVPLSLKAISKLIFSDKTSTMTELIDTPAGVTRVLDKLSLYLPTSPCYVDLEGIRLSRDGTISLVQIFVQEEGVVYLIDIFTLGAKAFTTPGSTGTTLKSILESPSATKYFFDVRNDSDALFSLYGIKLAGICPMPKELAGLPQRAPYICFTRLNTGALTKSSTNDQ